jgi:thiol-disulfide isomerase/thioredoxin
MKNRVLPLLLFFITLLTFRVHAEDGYVIKIRIAGVKDTSCLIAGYYGKDTFVKDTLKADGSGRMVFKAPADYPKGIYLVIINDRNYFEFIINGEKKFSLETDRKDLNGKMKISGSPENDLFYKYITYNQKRYLDIQQLVDLKKKTQSKDSLEMIDKRIDKINDEVVSYKKDIIIKNPDSFTTLLLNVMKEPEVPEIPVLANGKKDSTFGYRYYKAHYWDGVSFQDDRVLRTPVFHNKLKQYFDKVIYPTPDSAIAETDRLIRIAKPNAEMYKYLIWYSTYYYEACEIMGMDKVFVHLVDTYYTTGQTPWVNKTVLEAIIKKASRLRPLLIGERAPNMIMLDTNNQLTSLYAINAKFTLVLFWDPDCGHCEKEIPKIKALYDVYKEKYGMEVFAVCSDTNMVKWKKALRTRNMTWINVDGPRSITGNYHDTYDIATTPEIYLLNERKEIIAKRLNTEQIEGFIKNYSAKKGSPR